MNLRQLTLKSEILKKFETMKKRNQVKDEDLKEVIDFMYWKFQQEEANDFKEIRQVKYADLKEEDINKC